VLAVSQNSSLAALLAASLIAVYAGLVKELVSDSKTLAGAGAGLVAGDGGSIAV
jgi:hypothetical protein